MMKSQEENGPFNIHAEVETCVEFFQLDPMCIVWHGNYFNFFETGRRVLLEKIKFGYNDMKDCGYAFPVVEAQAKYLRPLRFLDRARIKAILVEYENCLKIKYEIRDAKTGALATRGMTTQMAFDVKTNESCFVCPQALIDKVEALIREQAENSK